MTGPLRVVLDTNVVLDCFVFEDALARPLVEAIESHRILALTRVDCLGELERVLDYPQLRLDPPRQASVLARYRGFVVPVGAAGTPAQGAPLPRCADRDDQKFLELARDAQAHYLVSKDKRVLELARRRSIRPPFAIVDVAGFVRALAG